MATISNITSGEQTVTATGAVAGSLDTSALTGAFTVKMRVRGLTAASKMILAIEDTANASAYSDKVQVHVKHFVGAGTTGVGNLDGDTEHVTSYDIPGARFGVANSALRATVLSLTGSSPTSFVYVWLEQ